MWEKREFICLQICDHGDVGKTQFRFLHNFYHGDVGNSRCHCLYRCGTMVMLETHNFFFYTDLLTW